MLGSRLRTLAAFGALACLVVVASPRASAALRGDIGATGVGLAPTEPIVLHGVSTASTTRKARWVRLVLPREVQSGDFLLATVTARPGAKDRITSPPGWRLVRRDANVGGVPISQALYYKIASRLDRPGRAHSWRFPSRADAVGAVLSFGGVDEDAPIEAVSGKYAANSRFITAAPVSTKFPDSLVVGVFGSSGGTRTRPSAGMTEHLDVVARHGKSVVSAETSSYFPGVTGTTGYTRPRSRPRGTAAIWDSCFRSNIVVSLGVSLLLLRLRRRLRRLLLHRHRRLRPYHLRPCRLRLRPRRRRLPYSRR
jgi:hypothetical protein